MNLNEDNLKKSGGYLSLVLILLYLAVEQLPWNRWFFNLYWANTAILITRVFFLCFAIWRLLVRHYKIGPILGKFPISLAFLPFFVLPFSNFVGSAIEGASYSPSYPAGILVLQGFSTLSLATLEELLFRFLLFSYLSTRMKKSHALLLSSAIFGLLHFLNLLGGASIGSTLLQVGYSFGNGLILGLLWWHGGGLLMPVLYHFLFNFFNDDLFTFFYQGDHGVMMMVTNIVFGAVALIYGILLYFLYLRKRKA